MSEPGRLPLDGVQVVTLEHAVAAPICTRHLADLGARVIKVEPVGRGDFARDYDTVAGGMAAHFVWVNRNKESLTLDVKHDAGRELLLKLVDRTDVFVHNLGPGALDRLQLAPPTLAARNPRLITVSISGYGSGGTLDHKRAYDLLVQAEGGACSITGWPGQPAKPGVPVADVGTGFYAASIVLTALFERERTGRGRHIEVSLFDTTVEYMGYALQHALHTGTNQPPNGLSSPAVAPYGAYETADGATVVLGTTNDREWQRYARDLLGRPDLAQDDRYAHNADRLRHRAELDEAIAAWCSRHDLADIQEAADRAGIGNSRYNTATEVAAHPHLVERNRWRTVGSPVGELPSLLPPATVAGWEPRLDPIPALGEHTDDILAELGVTREALAGLRGQGVV